MIKITRYENEVIELDKLQKDSTVKLETNLGNNLIGKVNKEIVVYSEDSHFTKASDEIKELYYKFKDIIIE